MKYTLFNIIALFSLTFNFFSCDFAIVPLLDENQEELEEQTIRRFTNKCKEFQFTNIDSAVYYANFAVKVANDLTYSKPKGIAYYYLGHMSYLAGDMNASEAAALMALKHIKEKENKLSLSLCYDLLGAIYTNLNNNDLAIKYMQKSLSIASESNDTIGLITGYNNLGRFYNEQEQEEMASSYYQKSLMYCQLLKDTMNIAICYLNLVKTSTIDTIRKKYLDTALILAQTTGNEGLISNVINGIGNQYFKNGNYAEALIYIDSCYKIRQRIDYPLEISKIMENMAECHLVLGRMDEAKSWALKALKSAQEQKKTSDIGEAFEVLSRVYEQKGNWREAYTCNQKYHKIRDSLLSIERTEIIADLELDYQLIEKDRNLAKAERDLVITEARNFRYSMVGLVIFFIMIFFFLWYSWRQKNRKKEAEYQMRLKENERSHWQEMHALKSVFLANISHELRTPLTLVLSPLKAMMNKSLQGNKETYLKMMSKNGERLEGLIDQLLNIARLEKNEWPEQNKQVELWSELHLLANAFESHAVNRNIRFDIDILNEKQWVLIDLEKLEQIILNLLSNAFKYTKDGGEVFFQANLRNERNLELIIRDTGKGIEMKDLPHVFDRFFRVEGQSDGPQMGTGIGLALVKNLTDWFKGEVQVASTVGKGTTFTVVLPLVLKNAPISVPVEEKEKLKATIKKPVVLIVEDHPDVRRMLAEQLADIFDIEQAADGVEGLERATELVPDLVILDVMMPKMDGRALCRRLKKQVGTSHIPIIMLTALSRTEEKIKGLEVAADHYLTKPFNVKEIKLIVNNMLNARATMGAYLKEKGVLAISKTVLPNMEKAFLDQLITTIESKLEEENYTVSNLASDVGLSRSQLHRKLVALIDQTPSQFMRKLRLQYAQKMLKNKSATISEIAYSCGFSSLSYFSRCFQEEYGQSPSSFMEGK